MVPDVLSHHCPQSVLVRSTTAKTEQKMQREQKGKEGQKKSVGYALIQQKNQSRRKYGVLSRISIHTA